MSIQIINDDYKKHFDLLNEDDVIVIDPTIGLLMNKKKYGERLNEWRKL